MVRLRTPLPGGGRRPRGVSDTREPDFEGRTCSRRAFDGNGAAVGTDDAVDGGQAETPALDLVVKKGSKILARVTGDIPQPVSETLRRTYSPSTKPKRVDAGFSCERTPDRSIP